MPSVPACRSCPKALQNGPCYGREVAMRTNSQPSSIHTAHQSQPPPTSSYSRSSSSGSRSLSASCAAADAPPLAAAIAAAAPAAAGTEPRCCAQCQPRPFCTRVTSRWKVHTRVESHAKSSSGGGSGRRRRGPAAARGVGQRWTSLQNTAARHAHPSGASATPQASCKRAATRASVCSPSAARPESYLMLCTLAAGRSDPRCSTAVIAAPSALRQPPKSCWWDNSTLMMR